MSLLGRVIRFSLSDGIPLRSGCIALVVGTILNLINQGDAIFGTTPVDWIKIVLTYLVPYGVSTLGRSPIGCRGHRNEQVLPMSGFLAVVSTVTLITRQINSVGLALLLRIPYAGQLGAWLLLLPDRIHGRARQVLIRLMAGSPVPRS